MNFPGLSEIYFEGIKFKLSSIFDNAYNDRYVLSSTSESYIVYDMNLHFSVEKFNQDEIESIKFSFEEEISSLNAIHDNYILKRKSSLSNGRSSTKTKIGNLSPYDGWIQIVQGTVSTEDSNALYFTATIEIEEDIFVFQLIGKEENMGYFYDDFLELIKSIVEA